MLFSFEEYEMEWELSAVHQACPLIPRSSSLYSCWRGKHTGRQDKESTFPKWGEDRVCEAVVFWQMHPSTVPAKELASSLTAVLLQPFCRPADQLLRAEIPQSLLQSSHPSVRTRKC